MTESPNLGLRVIAVLEAREGAIVSIEEIVAGLGSINWRAPRHQVTVAISRARDQLPKGCEILTIQGQGYMLRRR